MANKLKQLRADLRTLEIEISDSIAETSRWYELFRRQSQLHWAIAGEILWLKIKREQDAEIKRMEKEERDGEEWKGGAGGS